MPVKPCGPVLVERGMAADRRVGCGIILYLGLTVGLTVILYYYTVFLLNPNSGVPLYVQLQQQIQKRILSGQLPRRAQLPSVRDLSAELHVNPLTVAKVYQLLERDGFVETRRGIGTYVAHQSPALRLDARRLQIGSAVEQLVVEALHLGLGEREIRALLSDKFRQLTSKKHDHEPSPSRAERHPLV